MNETEAKNPLTTQQSGILGLPKDETDVEKEVLSSLLKQTGQITPLQNLNRSLYSNDFLNQVANASKITTPDVKPQDFGDLGLSSIQEKFLENSSKGIADQTNLFADSLEQQLTKQINSIVQASQGRAVATGMLIGDLGAPAETSTRNLSFVANAQELGKQQIVDITQESITKLSEIMVNSNKAQNELTGQAVQLETKKQDDLFREADRLTNNLGFLYEVQDNQVVLRKDADGNPISTLTQQKFEEDKLTSAVSREGAELDNEAKKFDNNANFTVDENGNQILTELGKKKLENQIGQANLNAMGIAAQTEALQALEEREVAGAQTNQQAADLASADPVVRDKAIADLEAKRTVKGQAYGIYWGENTTNPVDAITTDKDGNVTFDKSKIKTEVQYDDTAISTLGLFLNRNLNSGEYNAAVKDIAVEKRPDKLFTKQVKDYITDGDTQQNFNKIITSSDDGNTVMVAHRNISSDGDNYKFKLINTSLLNAKEKNDLMVKLQNVDQKNVRALDTVISDIMKQDKVLGINLDSDDFTSLFVKNAPLRDNVKKDIENKFQDMLKTQKLEIDSAEALKNIREFSSFTFSQSADKRMTDDLPKNRELLPIIFAGSDAGNILALKENKMLTEDLRLTNLSNDFNTGLNPYINQIKKDGLGALNDDDVVKIAAQIMYPNTEGDDYSKVNDNSEVYKQGKGFLIKLYNTYKQITANTKNDTQKKYKNSLFSSIILNSMPKQSKQETENIIKIMNRMQDVDTLKSVE